jgi:type IV pilus assembly protein PilA
MSARKRKAFTLIELMVVLAIIAILAAVAIPQYKRFQLKTKFNTAKENVKAIASANEGFAQESGIYAAASTVPAQSPYYVAQGKVWPAFNGSAMDCSQSYQTGRGFYLIGFNPQGKV